MKRRGFMIVLLVALQGVVWGQQSDSLASAAVVLVPPLDIRALALQGSEEPVARRRPEQQGFPEWHGIQMIPLAIACGAALLGTAVMLTIVSPGRRVKRHVPDMTSPRTSPQDPAVEAILAQAKLVLREKAGAQQQRKIVEALEGSDVVGLKGTSGRASGRSPVAQSERMQDTVEARTGRNISPATHRNRYNGTEHRLTIPVAGGPEYSGRKGERV